MVTTCNRQAGDSAVTFSKPELVWVEETLTVDWANGEKDRQVRRRLVHVSELEAGDVGQVRRVPASSGLGTV